MHSYLIFVYFGTPPHFLAMQKVHCRRLCGWNKYQLWLRGYVGEARDMLPILPRRLGCILRKSQLAIFLAITTSSILYDSVISNFLDTFLLENNELFSLVYQKRRIDGKFFRIRPVTCPAFGVRWGRCLLSVYGERYSHDRHTSLLISATHILTQQQTSSRQSKQSPIMLKLSKVTKTDQD